MKKALTFIACLFLMYGCATKRVQYGKNLNNMDYNYIKIDHAFKGMVLGVQKNNVLCGRIISYALLTVRPEDSNLPAKISVILPCDNQDYRFRDFVEIEPINIDTRNDHKHLLYFTVVKTTNNITESRIIGSEYPAVWAKVTKYQ